MSDIIRLLPDSVANQIAAGEVIQRPASVIKELVENSIDAGATEIEIRLIDAGRTLIQIIDNGKGMSQTDARLAFERHATSKIHKADDLFSLTTMGFRGEALASIAAVAQVELRTRTPQEEVGTLLEIAASKVERQEVISCPQGSNFAVKNLFYNIPARRKFLKSNHTEMTHILAEFQRIALVHPEVHFKVTANEQELFNLSTVNLRQRILQIFGKRLNQQLLPVEADTTLVHIHGFTGKPDSSRKKGAQTYFFVNNRFMRHPYFHKAVAEAYTRLIPEGEQISYFLYLTVPPADIDVNIHPTKTEIKFENEVPIWQIIHAAIKETLGKYELAPKIDFDTADKPDIPVFRPTDQSSAELPVSEPGVSFDPTYNPFDTPASRSAASPSYHTKSIPQNWESLYTPTSAPATSSHRPTAERPTQEDRTQEYLQPLPETPPAVPEIPAAPPVKAPSELFSTNSHQPEAGYQPFQFKGKYILISVKSGLMLIDQRRAHIRILFDRYSAQLSQHQGNGQRLLFPEIVELSPAEEAMLLSIQQDLTDIGFDLSPLGAGSHAIHAIPASIEGVPPTRLVLDLLHASMEKASSLQSEIHYELALTLARSAALIHGQALTPEEMSRLTDSLFQCRECNFTPDGKPIFIILKQDEIDRLFR